MAQTREVREGCARRPERDVVWSHAINALNQAVAADYRGVSLEWSSSP